jgi:hypothetical protein
MSENAQYGLIVSFEDQSASFVNGFECGKLAACMTTNADAEELEGRQISVHTANRVTIDRMCAAYGWSAEWQDTEYSEWSYLTLTRATKPTERPNPHGLRIVPYSPPPDIAEREAKRRHDYWEWEGAPGAA